MEHPSQILARYGLEPKKSLGQNFLFDDGILARIAEAGDISPTDQVLEIGPGLGSLTALLVARAARVVAVELDDRLLPILRDTVPAANLKTVHGDILSFDPEPHFGSQPYLAVGNVPYYITGAILRHLLAEVRAPVRAVLTLQDEVAARLLAAPGNLSLLAVSVRFYGEPTRVGRVRAGAFWPRPKVDSAVVRIDRRDPAQLDVPADRFFPVVRAGFAQRRKQLKNNLRGLGLDDGLIRAALESAGIDGRRRAETLSLADWIALTRALGA